ncbi:MAG: MarR family winged helix-turn-helix transcriptional regulator [Granulosicoccus sp.]
MLFLAARLPVALKVKKKHDSTGQPDSDLESRGLSAYAPYLMNRIMHRYNQSLQAVMAEQGLSIPKMRALAALAANGSLTVNELTVFAVSEQSTMSRTLDQLEVDGLVVRTASKRDSRVRVIELTESGRNIYRRIWPEMHAAEEALFAQIPQKQRDNFVNTLTQILLNIRQHDF